MSISIKSNSDTRVLILGSCVSRDPFGHPGSNDMAVTSGYSIVDYYARTSLASLATAAILGWDISSIPSPFQRRMVERDLKKSFFENLVALDFDVLLLDFIDDRFDLLLFSDDRGFTDSTEFKSASIPVEGARRLASGSVSYTEYWLKGLELLLRKLEDAGRLKALLVNEVFWATHDDEGGAFSSPSYIASSNKYLSRVYDQVTKFLPSNQFLRYDRSCFIGDTHHQWGRSPFHYVSSVGKACLDGVRKHHLSLE